MCRSKAIVQGARRADNLQLRSEMNVSRPPGHRLYNKREPSDIVTWTTHTLRGVVVSQATSNETPGMRTSVWYRCVLCGNAVSKTRLQYG